MKECIAQQERKQGTLKLAWEGKRHWSFTASAMAEKEWGKGVGINATLTLLIPDSILEILGTWTLVQSPWLDSVSKAEITA